VSISLEPIDMITRLSRWNRTRSDQLWQITLTGGVSCFQGRLQKSTGCGRPYCKIGWRWHSVHSWTGLAQFI